METATVAAWILRGRYTRVALQFPPELLAYAPAELSALARALAAAAAPAAPPPPAARLFLVGDTAFSPCCVDEVAAAHYSADAVVHYGPSCLSRTRALPAFHVLGPAPRAPLDAAACGSALWAQAEAAAAQGQQAVLVWDTALSAGLGGVLAAAAAAGGGAALQAQQWQCPPSDASDGGLDTVRWASPHASLFIPACRRAFPGAGAPAPAPAPEAAAAAGAAGAAAVCGLSLAGLPAAAPGALRAIYLGSSPARERVLVGALGGCAGGVWRIDPATGAAAAAAGAAGHARLLASRYRLVGLVKAAGSVGLVAGTLALEGHGALLALLQRSLAAAGKAVYTFLVGKVTPAKLANFHGTCDVFVLLACPEASLLEESAARSHAVPVATPHEALAALEELAVEGEAEAAEEAEGAAAAPVQVEEEEQQQQQQLAWDGTLLFSFAALMERVGSSGSLARAAARARQRALAEEGAAAAAAAAAAPLEPQQGGGSTALLDPSAGAGGGRALVVAGGSSEAARRLQGREWRGLAYDTPEDIASAPPEVKEGRTGRAAGYEGGR